MIKVHLFKYFVVPVKSDGEGFVVHQLPYFVAEPKKPDIAVDTEEDRDDAEHDPELEEEITSFLDTFFLGYTEGSTQELSYYTDGLELQTLDDVLQFEEIEEIDIYEEDEQYKVHADVIMSEANSQTKMLYPFSMELMKVEGRWIVADFPFTLGK
ncbi:conjugal transfer protein [Alteribacillus bidgolensis]|uniref:Conjugative transposon protein TcpC n=1 Tax=Alteribacillus bidgolensis TaxID=930129 RepID=A0A1G8RW11_9BACI|nr:conjugal transfer protein [Alteribacillus bidgolensis]SDJ20530.1 Conjugative transposon protein TcpC [Alteribacillus bidgolensis]